MARTNTNWEIVNDLQQNAAGIDCKEHFALADNAKVEIAKVRKTRHCVYNINYHLVWIPKTRMKVLVSPFKETVEQTLYRVCAWNGWTGMALQVMPDHIHLVHKRKCKQVLICFVNCGYSSIPTLRGEA